MTRILDQKFIAQGLITPAQDSLNDVIQNCDYQNLKDTLNNLCISVLDVIESEILSQDTKYTDE